MSTCDIERSGKLAFWLRSGGTGDMSGQGIDRENADGEEDKNCLGEHDDRGVDEEERVTTAPGLKFGR